jgi:hypothetical protein
VRVLPAFCAAIAIGVSGCATTEPLGRPPSSDEIARVNELARRGSLSVDYGPWRPPEEPDAPRADGPPCAGGACGTLPWLRDREPPVALAGADARTMTLTLADGQHATVPLEAVAGLRVSGLQRGRAAAIGAAAGATSAFGLIGMGFLIGRMEPAPGSACDATCARAFAFGTAGGALVGALVGAALGSTRRFEF